MCCRCICNARLQVPLWVSREQPHPDAVALKVAPLDGHVPVHSLPIDLMQVLYYVIRVPAASVGVNKGCHLQQPKFVLLLSDSMAVGCHDTILHNTVALILVKKGQLTWLRQPILHNTVALILVVQGGTSDLAQAAIKLRDVGQEGTGLLCSVAVVVQSLPMEVGRDRLVDQEGNLNMHCQPGDVLIVPGSCTDSR